MPGTADNYLTSKIALGPGKLYGGLGGTLNAPWDLGANIRLLLHTDGSPQSTQNPNALHLGMTEGGETWGVKPSKTDFFADEFIDPIASRVTAEEITLAGSLLQIADMAVQAMMNPTGVRSDVQGSQGITWGGVQTIIYRSFAVIWPVEGSTTLFQVFHIYKGYNDAGIAGQITSKKLGSSPFAIRGYNDTTRAAGDQAARLFIQNAGATS